MLLTHNETYGGRLLADVVRDEAGEVEGMNAKPLRTSALAGVVTSEAYTRYMRECEEAGRAMVAARKRRQKRMNREPRS